jgi:hypothetical protein
MTVNYLLRFIKKNMMFLFFKMINISSEELTEHFTWDVYAVYFSRDLTIKISPAQSCLP